MRKIYSAFALLALMGCQETAGPVATPSGGTAYTAKCKSSPNQCMVDAGKKCSGPYQVLDGYSKAGGLLADVLPGPTTWYVMTYQCGKSDGRMPQFPFRGAQYSTPTFEAPTYRAPVTTNCNRFGNNTSCTTF